MAPPSSMRREETGDENPPSRSHLQTTRRFAPPLLKRGGENPKPPDENPPARRHARRMSMRILLLAVALAFAAGAAAQPATEASWPSRAIHLIVPFPPAARRSDRANALGKARAGARPAGDRREPPRRGRQPRHRARREGRPDGYTIGISIPGPLAVNTVLYRKMEYDPFKDLAPVSLVGASPTCWSSIPSSTSTR